MVTIDEGIRAHALYGYNGPGRYEGARSARRLELLNDVVHDDGADEQAGDFTVNGSASLILRSRGGGWILQAATSGFQDAMFYGADEDADLRKAWRALADELDGIERLLVCGDCQYMLEYGRLPDALGDDEGNLADVHAEAIEQHWPADEWTVELDDAGENGEHVVSFTWRACEACGSTLAGERHPAVAMPADRF